MAVAEWENRDKFNNAPAYFGVFCKSPYCNYTFISHIPPHNEEVFILKNRSTEQNMNDVRLLYFRSNLYSFGNCCDRPDPSHMYMARITFEPNSEEDSDYPE